MVTDALAEKVHRLVEQRRVLLVEGQAEALVIGDSGPHRVVAGRFDVVCSCIAGGRGDCSHALVAMVAWQEEAS
jgi:hypothetical protein